MSDKFLFIIGFHPLSTACCEAAKKAILHSMNEERFLMLGMSSGAKLLVVCHCERESGEIIRIISARRATSLKARSIKVAKHES